VELLFPRDVEVQVKELAAIAAPRANDQGDVSRAGADVVLSRI
jgi:hypothetical protein